ncbi:MAG: ABC transporter ATP-binding protein [Candidatus Methanosuratincola petrocarbonis]|nr:ABC transporter ATP-binding protein [Candidatus Methanosuratincola sp.]
MDPSLAVEITCLRKVFGSFAAVDGLDLRIKKGEIYGLLGPNGAGKTTTIRMICGLMAPTSGEILVWGYRMPMERDALIRITGYMAQKFSLYEDLTVKENLEFYGRLYGIPRKELSERVSELLSFLTLEEFSGRLAGRLSGGMKQRLALGVALIHRPRLLILDEPTAGVDPPIRRMFWEYLRGLNKESVTILVTTHYMDEAENCDRIALVSRGRVVAEGTPRELKRRVFGGDLVDLTVRGHGDPASALPFCRVLERRATGGGGAECEAVPEVTLRVLAQDAPREIPAMISALERAGFTVLSASPTYVTLEDVFISVVEGAGRVD